jgi:3-dehydroquinate dehydratase
MENNFNWFLIMVSWDWDADKDALKKFQWVYRYLNAYNVKEQWERISANADDPRNALDFGEVKALNLIGQRKFVIIGRTTSDGVLKEIRSNITRETDIRVDVFPTTLSMSFETVGEERQYNWFLIMCSWGENADKDALEKFQWVYRYFNAYDGRDANDLRNAMDFASLKALDLIGQRKFVIIGRTTSNRVLQKISANVTLETAIRVDVFPATYVHEFAKLNIQRFDGIEEKQIKNV